MIGVAVLGSTGSIGRQTLEVIQAHPDRFRVTGLAVGGQHSGLEEQLAGPTRGRGLPPDARPTWRQRRWADGGLEELATADGTDIVVVATTGMTALPAVLAAVRAGRRVALANKEALVAGGHLVTAEPRCCRRRRLARSPAADRQRAFGHLAVPPGGTDRDGAASRAHGLGRAVSGTVRWTARVRDAGRSLAHPTWRMGPKVTIDSATLVNKAFEAMEARWLYRLPYSRIDAVIHPGASCTRWSSSPMARTRSSSDCLICASPSSTPSLPPAPALAGAARRAR